MAEPWRSEGAVKIKMTRYDTDGAAGQLRLVAFSQVTDNDAGAMAPLFKRWRLYRRRYVVAGSLALKAAGLARGGWRPDKSSTAGEGALNAIAAK
jgi:hypothetical protein